MPATCVFSISKGDKWQTTLKTSAATGEERDDAFDEMLDRAEADLEDAEAEEAADYEDDENEDGEEGATRSVGHVISDEMRAAALIDPDMPNPHGAIVEGANGGNGTIGRTA